MKTERLKLSPDNSDAVVLALIAFGYDDLVNAGNDVLRLKES